MATFRKTRGSTAQTQERTQAPAFGEPAREKIATRAYEIWLASGRPEGRDEENWYEAERELRSRAPAHR